MHVVRTLLNGLLVWPELRFLRFSLTFDKAVAAFAPDEHPDLVVEVEVLLAVMEVPCFLAAAALRLSFSTLLPIVVGERYEERRNMSTIIY
jgi:hypothetical protein